MSHYDAATVSSFTATSDGASNGIINASTNMTHVLVHKMAIVNTNGSNVCSATLHNFTQASANILAFLTTNPTFAAGSWELYKEVDFDPPLRFTVGLSVTIVGTNNTTRVYYTRT